MPSPVVRDAQAQDKGPATVREQWRGLFFFGAGEMNRTPDLLITNGKVQPYFAGDF